MLPGRLLCPAVGVFCVQRLLWLAQNINKPGQANLAPTLHCIILWLQVTCDVICFAEAVVSAERTVRGRQCCYMRAGGCCPGLRLGTVSPAAWDEEGQEGEGYGSSGADP